MQIFRKQPNDVMDYDIDMTDWLESGNSVASIALTAPPGITLDSTSISSPFVKVWLSGGTTGQTYKLSPVITLANGRELEVDFIIVVIDY